MSQRKTDFVTGEFYHIYNRGVDKRDIFMDQLDIDRFFQSMEEFNTINPIGSIYENRFVDKKDKSGSKASKSKLVDFIAYCLNPNHYHFILKQVDDKGVEKFMQRIGTGFAKYFNNKEIILEQFKNINEYEEFSISSLSDIIERKSKNFDFD